MQLDNLSLEELQALSAKVREKIEIRRREDEARLIEEIRQKAAQLGISADQLIGHRKGPKRAEGKRPVAAKFKHPETGAQWTGRGRKPAWVVEWVESGRSLDELQIG